MCNNVYDDVTDLEVCGFTKNTKNLNICDIVCTRVSTPPLKNTTPYFLSLYWFFISQFVFLVMTEENIFAYKLFCY